LFKEKSPKSSIDLGLFITCINFASMTLSYQLEKDDFLQYQLFVVSKNKRIKTKRLKNWLYLSASFFFLSVMIFLNENNQLGYIVLICAIATCCFYPFYERKQYKKHYEAHIDDYYKSRFGQTSTIEFLEDAIRADGVTGQSSINHAAIESIIETGNYFYLQITSGSHFIIPKSKLGNTSNIKHQLKDLAVTLKIDFIEDLNWKWK
jgi:hypothetical protein